MDVLVNNAGVLIPKPFKTAEGFELNLGVNHLGPALLTRLLLPRLEESKDGGRIINVTCAGAKGFIPILSSPTPIPDPG